MICQDCADRIAEVGRDTCFRCRIKSVGFTFVGGGGYGRQTFAERTTKEYMNEFLGGGPKHNPDISPLSDYKR